MGAPTGSVDVVLNCFLLKAPRGPVLSPFPSIKDLSHSPGLRRPGIYFKHSNFRAKGAERGPRGKGF